MVYPSGHPKWAWWLPAHYHNELLPVQETNFQQQDDEIPPEELADDPPQMNIDEEDVNVDSNSNALSESISFFNTTTNLYNIFQSFLGEIPCFTPHGTLDSLCDSPNFDIAKMK